MFNSYFFFVQFDLDGNGHITSIELHDAMKACGEDIPGYKLRQYIEEVDANKNGQVEFDEFVTVSQLIIPNKSSVCAWPSSSLQLRKLSVHAECECRL